MSSSPPRRPDGTPEERRLPATGAMLKETLRLYRADAARFVAVVAVLNAPMQAVTALLNLTAPRIPPLTVSALVNLPSLQGSTLRLARPFTTAHLSAIVEIGVRAVGGLVLSSLVGVLTTAALATVIVGRMEGRSVGVGAAYRAVAARLGALLAAFGWAAIRFAILFLLCPTIVGLVAFIYVLVAWALIPQAVMLEGSGGGAASGRSRRLVKGHWQQASNLFIVVVVLVLALIGVPSALFAAALGHLLGLPSPLLQTVLSIGIAFVVQPLAAAATTVLYIELKARAAAAPLLDAA